jgi:hypothetical protein
MSNSVCRRFLNWDMRWGQWSTEGAWQVPHLDGLARSLSERLPDLRFRPDPPAANAADAALRIIGPDGEWGEVDVEQTPSGSASFSFNGAGRFDHGAYFRFERAEELLTHLDSF